MTAAVLPEIMSQEEASKKIDHALDAMEGIRSYVKKNLTEFKKADRVRIEVAYTTLGHALCNEFNNTNPIEYKKKAKVLTAIEYLVAELGLLSRYTDPAREVMDLGGRRFSFNLALDLLTDVNT